MKKKQYIRKLYLLAAACLISFNAAGQCQANFNFQVNGSNVSFTNLSTGSFINAIWSFGDGSTSGSPNPNHNYNGPGNYNVCLIISDPNQTCMDTICKSVNVNILPICQANFSYTIAASTTGGGYIVSFHNTSLGNFNSVAWDFGDNQFSIQRNPDHAYFASGTYKVCLTITDSSRNCHDVICKNITLSGGNPGCVDTSLINPSALCFTLYQPVCGCNGVTYGNPCEAEHWGGVTSWTQGPCPNTGGCDAQFSYSFIVGIAGYTVSFNNTSTGNYDFSLWDFGNGDTSSKQNSSYTYFASSLPAVIEVCLTITDSSNQCQDTYCETLNFNPQVCFDPSIINQNTICPLAFVPVCGCNGMTYNNACEAFYWNGITSWTPGPCPATQGCQANFSTAQTGSAVNFTNTSTGGYTFSAWDFGDGSPVSFSKNATHNYTAPGRYTVCLIIADSSSLHACKDTICQPITISGPNAPCTDSSLLSATPCPSNYEPVCGCNGVTYSNACIATTHGGVTNWVHGPCAIVITNPCKAFFNFNITATPIGYEVHFNNQSNGNITHYTWDFGDGTTAQQPNPTHTYLVPGHYVVCLTVSNNISNCNDTYCVNVYVNAGNACFNPSAIDTSVGCPGVIAPVCGCDGKTYVNSCTAFYRNGVTYWTPGACNSGGCQANFSHATDTANGEISFTNTSLGPHTQVYWDFGDGNFSVQNNPLHVYGNTIPEVFNVCLSVYDAGNGCYDTYCRNITVSQVVNVNCVAHFIAVADTSNLSAEFTNQSTGPVSSYLWDFGDGNTDNSDNPVHVYPAKGSYYACLTVGGSSSGCADTFCDSVRLDFSTSIAEIQQQEMRLKVFPNPFNESTNIVFELEKSGEVNVEIFDMVGRRIEVLAEGNMQHGLHKLAWDSRKFESGIYLLVVNIEGKKFTERLSLVRGNK